MNEPDIDFDQASYEAGKTAFDAGTSLRDILQSFAGRDLRDPKSESRVVSFAIGFGDALISSLRLALGKAGG